MHRLTLLALVLATAAAAGQTPTRSSTDVFEVATVKRNVSGEAVMGLRRPPGGIVMTNAPAVALVGTAFELQPTQMDGGPDWLNSARFDVTARLAAGAGTGQGAVASALRALLVERFELAVHWETRERPVYLLTVDRADGRLGPNLKPAEIDCAARQAEAAAAASEGRPAPPPIPPNPADRVLCGLRGTGERFQFGGYPLSMFVGVLGTELNRQVLDRTGLTGVWTFDLKYSRIRQLPGADPAPVDAALPSIFTALREQLGLKLEAATAPVPILVIDRMELPTPD